MIDILFIAVETAQQAKDIWDILETLALPIVLAGIAVIPVVLKKSSDTKRSADKASSAAEKVQSTGEAQMVVLGAMEDAFIHIGELHSDIKEVNHNVGDITKAFHDHVESDQNFMDDTRIKHGEILEQIAALAPPTPGL